jgi:hypothetical protein
MSLQKALENRFGENRVHFSAPINEGDFALFLLDLEINSKRVFVVCTSGLSDYNMPVDEVHKGKEHNEIYFCLPDYWDMDNMDNPAFQWVFQWIQTLAKYVVEKKTWFAHGHTIPAGNPPQALSHTMQQNYFMFCEPILLHDLLQPVYIHQTAISFLAIVPIFRKEWLYKTSRNTSLFMKKFMAKGGNEQLDEYRKSVLERTFFKFFPF